MNTFWNYFVPIFAAGIVIGTVAGAFAFRLATTKKVAWRRLAVGVAACIIAAAAWHGPLGAANRLASEIEHNIRVSLTSWEMPQITGHVHHGPLSRRVQLSGQADAFQRSELALIIETVPGVSSAHWSDRGAGIPLLAEGTIAALLGFLLGLLLAYLVELRRRHNAQWNW